MASKAPKKAKTKAKPRTGAKGRVLTEPPGGKGRPTKLTPELQAKIVAYLEEGNYVDTSAAAAGVSRSTVHDWLRRGAKGEPLYRDFSDAVDEAQAKAEANDLQRMRLHGVANWQAVAWRLERRHPDRWGRRERLEVTQEATHYVVEVPPKAKDSEEWAKRYQA